MIDTKHPFPSPIVTALVPLSELGIELQQIGFSGPSHYVHATKSTADSFQKKPSANYKSPNTGSEIIYLHIYEDPRFSLGIFCLPADAEIPLHNHPGMTVFSRVLYGTMHVQSYDLKDPACLEKGAITVHNRNFTAEDAPMSLFPTNGGNIHQFKAVTDCAVLDLLSPPYSTEDGRDCTYYRPTVATGAASIPGESIVLEECDPPEDFVITSEQYHGLAVNPASRRNRFSHDLHRGDEGDETTTPSWSSGGSAGSPRSVTPPGDLSGDCCGSADGEISAEQAARAAALASKLESSHLSNSTGSRNTLESC
jgi:plant cysteine oxidase